MESLQGYEVTARLVEEGGLGLYRARGPDGAVLLRASRAVPAPPLATERLENEWRLAPFLEPAWAIVPRSLAPGALVLADFAGEPLEAALGEPLGLARFFALAVPLARALQGAQARQLVHQDLSPANILVDPGSGALRLTGFGLAARLSRAAPAIRTPRFSRSSLAYLAPEQTGRTAWGVDGRSDLYALGAIFYRMLTGRRLCEAEDPLGWILCHLAQVPPSLRALRDDLPEPLDALVSKLLAKLPDERYQSARGLLADLEACEGQWRAGGAIAPFTLGRFDVPDRFELPGKLYDRDAELDALRRAHARVLETGAPELVLLAGEAGSGKTRIAREFGSALLKQGTAFAEGKFDPFKRGRPYAILAEAFDGLIQPILTERESESAVWRRRLEVALGPNGRAVAEVVPSLSLLVGPQPPLPEVEPAERRQRLHHAFQRFLGALATPDRPVVLFLDDLQWMDAASLGLLQRLLSSPGTRHLLLIGAYRPGEVGPEHPLARTLAALREGGAPVGEIPIGAIAPQALGSLVADLLRVAPAQAAPLAELVHAKTGGNFLFALQLLIALYQEGAIAFDDEAGRWRWDLARIGARGTSANVAALMLEKLRRLEPATRAVLQLAAASGPPLVPRCLAALGETTLTETRQALEAAEQEGLVFREDGAYCFAHDRIQQAAYALLPEPERPALHLRIGRRLLALTPPERLDESLFEIVDHLNRAVGELEAPAERLELAELNARAGARAKARAAYAEAITYLAAGVALLPADRWRRCYALAFELQLQLAESRLLNGELDEAERLLVELKERARSRRHAAAAVVQLINLLTPQGRFAEAIAHGCSSLGPFGITITPRPGRARLRREYRTLKQEIGERRIAELGALPPMADPEARAAFEILVALLPTTYLADPPACCLVALRMARYSCRFGNADGSFYGYALLGGMLGVFLGEYASADQFGQLASDGVAARGLVGLEPKVLIAVQTLITPWTRPLETSLAPLRRALDGARQLGDLFYAASAGHLIVTRRLALGDPLAEVDAELAGRLAFVRPYRLALIEAILIGQERLVKTLRGLTPRFGSFDDESFDQAAFEAGLARAGPPLALATCWYYVRKTIACFMAGEPEEARRAAEAAEPLLADSAFFERAQHVFYAGLAHAGVATRATGPERQAALAALNRHRAQLRTWARHAPANFDSRLALLSVERARLAGQPLAAERLYEEALASARTHGRLPEEALGFELAAAFYRTRGFGAIAEAYLRSARARYARWGAAGKVRQLEALHPFLRAEGAAEEALGASQLDQMAAFKAAQAVSGEIVLPRLIATLMRVALESSGAQRGALVLAREGALWLHAEASAEDAAAPTVLESPAPADSRLPHSILAYVARTHQKVLLTDASGSELFASDDALARTGARSLLCLPIVRQTELVGMLYLENRLLPGAFTPERLGVLELLASQAAIALENATLYAELQLENAVRRRAEAALRQSEARFRAFLDNSTAVICLKDLEGRYLLANRWAGALIGRPPAELLGKTDLELLPRPQAEPLRANDRQVAESGRPLEFEEELVLDDGPHTFLVLKFPLFDQAGKPYAVGVIGTDVTERKRGAETLARQTAELAQARELDRLKSRFVDAVSHELRTPLTSIMGYAEFLEDEVGGPLGAAQREFVTQIQLGTRRLERLVDDLLDFARLEAGTFQLRLDEVDLAAKVREVIESLKPQSLEAGVTLTSALMAEPVLMRLDAHRIGQVLINLVNNAIKFTPRGGRIRVRLRREGRRVRCEVEDSGIGIAEADFPKLFQRFSQLESGLKEGKGTGLGLSISKAIVEAHGGEIGVRSRPGEGATFWFTLPLAPADA